MKVKEKQTKIIKWKRRKCKYELVDKNES